MIARGELGSRGPWARPSARALVLGLALGGHSALADVPSGEVAATRTTTPTWTDDEPVALIVEDGGLGGARSAIPRSAFAVSAGGSILAAFDDFYGHLRARAVVSASWAVAGAVECELIVEAVRAETVISSLQAGRIGFGTTTLGATWRLVEAPWGTLALASRVVLPTDLGAREHALPLGLDLAVLASVPLAEGLEAHAHGIGLGSGQISDGPTLVRVGLALGAGVAWRTTEWLSVVGDVGVQAGYDDPLDRLTLALAARLRLAPRVMLELAGTTPVAGADRTLAVVALGLRLGE
jgi:hypothetical protein